MGDSKGQPHQGFLWGGLCVFEGHPGFVLPRYDKTQHGNDCFEERSLFYLQICRNRKHATQGGLIGKHHVWSVSRRTGEKWEQELLLYICKFTYISYLPLPFLVPNAHFNACRLLVSFSVLILQMNWQIDDRLPHPLVIFLLSISIYLLVWGRHIYTSTPQFSSVRRIYVEYKQNSQCLIQV